jgi:hypothetical protein
MEPIYDQLNSLFNYVYKWYYSNIENPLATRIINYYLNDLNSSSFNQTISIDVNINVIIVALLLVFLMIFSCCDPLSTVKRTIVYLFYVVVIWFYIVFIYYK